MRQLPGAADVLRLPFLGKRNYLHGTTLFEELRQYAPRDSRYIFKIPRIVESDKIILLDMTAAQPSEPFFATLYWTGEAGDGGIGVYPLPRTAEPERQPYEESLVTSQALQTGNQIEYRGSSPFSFVATLIPLNKVLLAAHISHKKPGQWFFTRFDVSVIPEKYEHITLVWKASSASRIAKSEVLAHDELLGHIYFSWVDA